MRGGSAPETLQVTFELSTDGGVIYTPLGAGTRIAGGWEKTGLSLPASGQIRARARTTGSYVNGSSGLVEKVQAFTPAGTLEFSAGTHNVNENGGSVTITVTRSGNSIGAVSVSYATSDGTATAGSDYTAANGTLSWANGDTASKTFTLPILEDCIYEGSETVLLTLSNPAGGAILGSQSDATLTILDNDSTASLFGIDYAVNMGLEPAFVVSSVSGTVDWGDGTQTTITSSTILLHKVYANPGSYTISVSANWTGRPNIQADLIFGPVSGHYSRQDVVQILPTPPAGALQFSAAAYSHSENGGSATITVTRIGGGSGAVGVTYATGSGTATAGSDYTAASGTLNWADCDTASKMFIVPILDDCIYEGSEVLNLVLSSPSGGAILGTPSTAVLTIVDDETAAGCLPPLAVTRFTYAEGERLRVFFQRDPTHNDVTLEVQAADSPAGPWATVAISTLGAPFNGPGYVSGDDATPGLKNVEVRDTVNVDAASSRFLRLKVTH